MTESQIDAYVRATDEANDFTTARIDSFEQQSLEDQDELFRNVEERDPELWGRAWGRRRADD